MVATVALVLSLGGAGAVAVAVDRIGSNEIARNAVLSRHVDNGALSIRDMSKRVAESLKLRPNELTGEQIDEGSLSLETYASTELVTASDGNTTSLTARPECDPGDVVLSGGADTRTPGWTINVSVPSRSAEDPQFHDAWAIQVSGPAQGDPPPSVFATALCSGRPGGK